MKKIKNEVYDMGQWKIPWSGRSHNFSDEQIRFLVEVIKTGDPLTQGKYLRLFESKLSDYFNVAHDSFFAVDSGTSALELTAILSHIEEGDEVIVPAHTFCASALPFLRRKAKIVWADIDPNTWLIDIHDVARKVTDKTKAIVLVHLYGCPIELEDFLAFASNKSIVVIEDAAQAFGAQYNGQKVGVLGDMGIFSFHGQKNMTTLGEGGAIYVKNKELAKKVPSLRSFGVVPFPEKEFYWKPAMVNLDSVVDWELPHKFTISEIQCAAGYALLDNIDELNRLRKSRYWKFRNCFSDFPELKFQKIGNNVESAYHLMPAKYEGYKYGIKATREDVINHLSQKYSIQAIVQYYPLYRYDLFKKWGCGQAQCPNVDNFFDNMLSFPFHVWMNENDFDYLIASTIKTLKRLKG